MNHKSAYQTNQKDKVLEHLIIHTGEHITAGDVFRCLKKDGVRIGLTTVYRHLEKLASEGVVVKYVVDENTPACFEYTGHAHGLSHENCYHCKCVSCGKLIHMHCEEIEKLEKHIWEDHAFFIDPKRTVFYGYCEECLSKKEGIYETDD